MESSCFPWPTVTCPLPSVTRTLCSLPNKAGTVGATALCPHGFCYQIFLVNFCHCISKQSSHGTVFIRRVTCPCGTGQCVRAQRPTSPVSDHRSCSSQDTRRLRLFCFTNTVAPDAHLSVNRKWLWLRNSACWWRPSLPVLAHSLLQ